MSPAAWARLCNQLPRLLAMSGSSGKKKPSSSASTSGRVHPCGRGTSACCRGGSLPSSGCVREQCVHVIERRGDPGEHDRLGHHVGRDDRPEGRLGGQTGQGQPLSAGVEQLEAGGQGGLGDVCQTEGMRREVRRARRCDQFRGDGAGKLTRLPGRYRPAAQEMAANSVRRADVKNRVVVADGEHQLVRVGHVALPKQRIASARCRARRRVFQACTPRGERQHQNVWVPELCPGGRADVPGARDRRPRPRDTACPTLEEPDRMHPPAACGSAASGPFEEGRIR